MDGVKGMILAAGLGERLRPLTERLPKALVEVGGRPLIDHAIGTMARSGISDVIINLHHLGDMIADHVGDGSGHGVRVSYSREEPLQGSGGGILAARHLLGQGPCVTLNADTIIDVDLAELVAAHLSHDAAATLVVRKDPQMESYGIVSLCPDRRIGRFLDTAMPGCSCELDDHMFAGVQVLGPRVFDHMPAQGPFSITRTTYPEMLAAGQPLFGFPFDGPWTTVGTADELEQARRRLDG